MTQSSPTRATRPLPARSADGGSDFSRPKTLLGGLGWLLLVYGAAAIAGLGSVEAAPFYRSLEQPSWAPAPWLFGPVWSVLYTGMAVAAWLVWRRSSSGSRSALALFLVQLAVNALWSWLFFAWKQGGLAFACIALLVVLVAATAVQFWRHSRIASTLLWPYLGWVAFASALNLAMWRLNPSFL
ncbi:MAG: TspO/MBR family protein [Acidobacteriota bacterium]